MMTVITAGRLMTPGVWIDAPVVVVESGTIVSVQSRTHTEIPGGARTLDFPELILAPGFIDIHIHGGAGHDVMEEDESSLARMEARLTQHGVTAYLPTTVTASENRILSALERLGRASRRSGESAGRACPIGIHLEGPFISQAKRGVHPPQDLMPPSPHLLDRFWQASEGTIRMITIAPELTGALETIAHARRLGVHCSVGHSNATYGETRAAISAGADHATHTFNAMRALDHRDPGILGAIFEDDTLSADIIADGIHVDPSIVRLFLRAKGDDRAILITDAISATGMPDGTYRLGDFEVQVQGGCCLSNGKLAGSVLRLDQAVRNVMSFAKLGLQSAVKMVTENPARLLEIAGQHGRIAPGCRADLVALTPSGQVVHTLIGGEMVY